MKKFTNRFSMMVGNDAIDKLASCPIILFGVGGVGGTVAEMLVRSGVENLTIVDFDIVDETNINRQILATAKNIGKKKVDEMTLKLMDINPNIQLQTIDKKFCKDNFYCFDLKKYDVIIDCIDSMADKKLLISTAKMYGKYIISAMGAGNRFGIPNFEFADISKTSYDPIAKIIRKFCADEKIKKLDVVYTKEKHQKFDDKTISSVVYYPWNMATVLCSVVINKIVKGEIYGNNK